MFEIPGQAAQVLCSLRQEILATILIIHNGQLICLWWVINASVNFTTVSRVTGAQPHTKMIISLRVLLWCRGLAVAIFSDLKHTKRVGVGGWVRNHTQVANLHVRHPIFAVLFQNPARVWSGSGTDCVSLDGWVWATQNTHAADWALSGRMQQHRFLHVCVAGVIVNVISPSGRKYILLWIICAHKWNPARSWAHATWCRVCAHFETRKCTRSVQKMLQD